MSLLAIIPARSGSKRVPGKNLRNLGGKPLIAWTIEAALGSMNIDRIVVSTDDPRIANISESFGIRVSQLRSPELSTDTATSSDVVLDVLAKNYDYDEFILLQPTSPFRSSIHIDEAFEIYCSNSCVSLISIKQLQFREDWLLTKATDNKLHSLLSVSSGKPLYTPNGAIYLKNIKHFQQNPVFLDNDTYSYIMDERSSIDIDTEQDFLFSEFVVSARQGTNIGS